MMIEVSSSFITQTLSPALAISGIAILISGLNTRVLTLGGRVRDINHWLRQGLYPSPETQANALMQVSLFLSRLRMLRNALFLLYGALSLMIMTAFAIALTQLHLIYFPHLAILTFLTGLLLVFVAVVLEALEISLNLRALKLDIQSTQLPLPH